MQVHIAQEETKFGLDEEELKLTLGEVKNSTMNNVRVCGLMGMASFSDDMEKVRNEFRLLKKLFENHTGLTILSMGMSSDYKIAVEEGSTMVRIGSLLFGERLRN